MLAAAARRADAWNGWAMDAEAFGAAAATVRRLADGRAVEVTWGGIVLVGEDDADLERLRADRASRGLPTDLWQGTADDLRSFVARLEDAGATWFIPQPVGAGERLELVAAVLA
jgi:alkanesulfonate monooxygenase SsuD/methylene tetrahydromethanopterin reductase-like flavin-dependent oxidoreductase (luciferase family)